MEGRKEGRKGLKDGRTEGIKIRKERGKKGALHYSGHYKIADFLGGGERKEVRMHERKE